jgi:hypothetical protein
VQRRYNIAAGQRKLNASYLEGLDDEYEDFAQQQQVRGSAMWARIGMQAVLRPQAKHVVMHASMQVLVALVHICLPM